MKVLARGAEAIIYESGEEVIKYREKKSYRIPEIDAPLRKSRTKIEFSILKKCFQSGLNVPAPIKVSKEGDKLYMKKIDGVQLDYMFSVDKMEEVGKLLAELHKLGIAHGDLTTANILVNKAGLFFIDFGLSYFSKKDESRATDIFLFKNALKARHTAEFGAAYSLFLSSYGKAVGKEFKGIETHLKDIERRGRYHEDN